MKLSTYRSEQLFREAKRHIAGGVNSPSRSFDAVNRPHPIIIERGQGAHLWDVDGNHYIDYVCAYGALLLGHAHPHVVEAVQRAIVRGSVYGAPTELEIEMARRLKEAIPFVDMFRFNVSGTEAVMTAIRVARGYTGRYKILKFTGSYHGHSDPVLVEAGSGSSTLGIDESLGIPPGVKADMISVPFNNFEALEEAFAKYGEELAACLLEPIVGNFGIVPPKPGYLERISELARQAGALVIWDEVITAFRFRPGSVEPMFDCTPDLITLGKLIGGGMPIGAYGGSAEIMQVVAPLGGVYQDGTLAGNPISMAAGLAFLESLDESIYERTAHLAMVLADGIQESAERHGIDVRVGRFGGALSPYFTDKDVSDFDGCEESDSEMFARFFGHMIDQGIFLAPSKYEAWFVSAAHTEDDIAYTLEAVDKSFARMARGA